MRTKKFLYTAGIVLAVITITSINNTETKAGIFGKYGKLKGDIDFSNLDSPHPVADCVYSLKSNCKRSDWD